MMYFTDGESTFKRDKNTVFKWDGDAWGKLPETFDMLCRFMTDLEEVAAKDLPAGALPVKDRAAKAQDIKMNAGSFGVSRRGLK